MTKHYLRRLVPLFIFQAVALGALAQTVISGKVSDAASGDPVPGVNIVVKGTVLGVTSDKDGAFSMTVKASPPLTLSVSYIGYKPQEVAIAEANVSNLEIKMEEESTSLNEIVVSVSRISEKAIDAPVTNEKMDRVEIQQSATPDFYDGLANMKGVQVNSGSLNLTSVNTRGFATIANERFVQWVDGMDTQSPILNFPTGSIMGVGELDAESMELIPGAASALYGPNAFNGILLMNSKSPFEFKGLSAQYKGGVVRSDAGGSNPLNQISIRYANSFANKFAFKVNFSYMQTTDWLGNDYKTDRNRPESQIELSGNPNFDGLNLYGDETPIPVPIGGTFGTLDLRRTGYKEEDLLAVFDDNRDAKTIKGDAALHYRINDKMEVLYNYRYGGGSSIYQGAEKYILRGFTQQFHKLELRGANFFVRAYQSGTDAGDSYNMSALGGFLNETISPTAAQWAPLYAQTYVLAMQGYVNGVPAGDAAAAHLAARANADNNPLAPRPLPGSAAFNSMTQAVRDNFFQSKNLTGGARGGASFIDDSKLRHGEFNYKFFEQIKFAEIQVGGNFRQYDLNSSGTVYNDAPDDGVSFERTKINEFGVYTQIAKKFGDRLKLTGSFRYDKNENFDGQATPRIAAVFKLAENNNLRASYQTGFRNPGTQAQFIYFPSSGGTLLGSTEANAGRYGVHNGGAYTQDSYLAFRATGGTLNPDGTANGGNASLLVTANVPYVQPEHLSAFEFGYKGIIAKKILVDVNYYYSSYRDFIGGQIVAVKQATTHQGTPVNAGTLYSLYSNSDRKVNSQGVGVGVVYTLPRNFEVNANYNYAKLDANEDANFQAGFNTPTNRLSFGVSNRKVIKNLGFNINFRYQEEFQWQSSFGNWLVPKYGVLDAQINYKIPAIKTMFKIGGTNLGGGDYRTNFGSPFVGQQYYISVTFDEFLK
jgi:iron complex outermembrane recepter protein